jgi:hypothetical protein
MGCIAAYQSDSPRDIGTSFFIWVKGQQEAISIEIFRSKQYMVGTYLGGMYMPSQGRPCMLCAYVTRQK